MGKYSLMMGSKALVRGAIYAGVRFYAGTRRKPVVRIDVDKYLCKGCYICVDKCPTKVFEVSNVVGDYGAFLPVAKYVERCIDCGICELYCPDYAITIIRGDESEARG